MRRTTIVQLCPVVSPWHYGVKDSAVALTPNYGSYLVLMSVIQMQYFGKRAHTLACFLKTWSISLRSLMRPHTLHCTHNSWPQGGRGANLAVMVLISAPLSRTVNQLSLNNHVYSFFNLACLMKTKMLNTLQQHQSTESPLLVYRYVVAATRRRKILNTTNRMPSPSEKH